MSAPELPTSAFDYELPDALIARHPAAQRDESRLLVLDRASGAIAHRRFRDLLDYVSEGDVIVLNETRVLPARLLGTRPSGAEAEVLLLRPVGTGSSTSPDAHAYDWEALVRPGAKLKPGKHVRVSDELEIEVLDVLADGVRRVRLLTALDARAAIEKYGRMPLPPYIDREVESDDRERYQTVYARTEGSVAAPTAGLHFTPELLARLEQQGVRLARILLHVGIGTFRPVEVEDPARHVMHEEWYQVPRDAADTINDARRARGKVWAVGTTVTRTLESVARDDGRIESSTGWTRLYIRPGYRFKVVDRLLTNFHLPRSTLLMLVSALGGYEHVLQAYREAVAQQYRFYSYGDAMAVL